MSAEAHGSRVISGGSDSIWLPADLKSDHNQ